MIAPLMSRDHHAILVHCLGLNMVLGRTPARSGPPHRNYYCSSPGQDGHELVEELLRAGYMEKEKGQCYRATRAGMVVGRLLFSDYEALVGVLTRDSSETTP